jgi:hypothetical protein
VNGQRRLSSDLLVASSETEYFASDGRSREDSVRGKCFKTHVSLHTNTLVICVANILHSLLTSEARMKRFFALMLMAVCLGTALSGCIVVPEGGYYHRY